jgi:hypothetical protein
MEENFNWNLASNAQLKEECERLEIEFSEKQQKMKETGYLLSLSNFVVSGDYFIHYGKGTYMHVVKIEEE